MGTFGTRGHKTICFPDERAENSQKAPQIAFPNAFASVRSRVRSPSSPPKMEIAAVKTAAISRLTTEIPQTDFCFDYLTGAPFGECPSFLFSAAQVLRGIFPQNSCPGSFNFSLGGKLRSNSSAAASLTCFLCNFDEAGGQRLATV